VEIVNVFEILEIKIFMKFGNLEFGIILLLLTTKPERLGEVSYNNMYMYFIK